jgi:hypothetical protein
MANSTSTAISTGPETKSALSYSEGAPLAKKWLNNILDGGEPARSQDDGEDAVKTAAA